jgi:hypothetical protein
MELDKEKMLKKRVFQNFAGYKAKILKLNTQSIFEKAEEIAACTQVYNHMIHDHKYAPEEIEYFLLFQNPLEVVFDRYRYELRPDEAILNLAIMDACDTRDALADYPLVNPNRELER